MSNDEPHFIIRKYTGKTEGIHAPLYEIFQKEMGEEREGVRHCAYSGAHLLESWYSILKDIKEGINCEIYLDSSEFPSKGERDAVVNGMNIMSRCHERFVENMEKIRQLEWEIDSLKIQLKTAEGRNPFVKRGEGNM